MSELIFSGTNPQETDIKAGYITILQLNYCHSICPDILDSRKGLKFMEPTIKCEDHGRRLRGE